MALLINKNLTVLGDISLSQLYVRLVVGYGPGGTPVTVNLVPYASKTAYDAGEQNAIHVDGVSGPVVLEYDRAANGSDVLTYVHDEIKSLFTTDLTEEVPMLDPSTGGVMLDPSTGEELTETVVVTPKFVEDSSISIVDID